MQSITPQELEQLIRLRKKLHQRAEVSSEEDETARIIKDWFAPLNPDKVIENLGGHGLAFVFAGKKPGKIILLRCEMDGLPIQETSDVDYRSFNPLTSHTCGHDGHMAIIAAVGLLLSKQRLKRGKVSLLFQPAEETGRGAAQVLADPKFMDLKPDFLFALHLIPKYPFAKILIRKGTFNCASKGIVIKLTGRTSHAAYPEHGISPTLTVSRLLSELTSLPHLPEFKDQFSLVTITHTQIGEKTLGISPGVATVMAVLRSESDDVLSRLSSRAEEIVRTESDKLKLKYHIEWKESFKSTMNNPEACAIIETAAKQLNFSIQKMDSPFRWSEDFGEFTSRFPGAMFGLGSGEDQPQLHNPDFDFPDKLIPIGIKLFWRIIKEITDE